jgi:hypothetical protein
MSVVVRTEQACSRVIHPLRCCVFLETNFVGVIASEVGTKRLILSVEVEMKSL